MSAESSWPVIGHEHAVARLRQSLRHGRARHAWLLSGSAGLGRHTLARSFAMALNCQAAAPARPCQTCRPCRRILAGNHVDLLYAEQDSGGVLRIDAIRAVLRGLALRPFEARHRVAIFRDFERVQPRAQDALLKTLEEPPPAAVLILIATSANALLPTITSRCQRLVLRPLPFATLHAALVQRGVDEPRAELLARLSGGRVGWALRALSEETALQQRAEALDLLEDCLGGNRADRFAHAQQLARRSRPELRALLEQWQTLWRDLLLLCSDSAVPRVNSDRAASLGALAQGMQVAEVLRALNATRLLMTGLRSNMQLRLALEVLLLEYPGLQRG